MAASALFDQFGREIPMSAKRKPDMQEIHIAGVRDRWSTYPSKGLTPIALATILEQADSGDVARQAELFEELEEKDAHIGSQFQTRKLAVQGLEYDLLPMERFEDDARALKIVDFCREVIEDLQGWEESILDLLDAIPKGYSLSEIVWDVSGGQAIPKAIRWIHPKKVTFVDSLTPRILADADPARGVEPPAWRCLYHRHKARSGYDTRAGIMRTCAWMYLFKNYSIKDWVAFSEVYGMPIRIGKYEPGAGPAEKTALLNAVRSLGSDAAGIISKATEIEFIESQKTSTLNIYESLANFCDAQVSKAVLGQTLTSDAGGTRGEGSYALGKVHADVRADLLKSDAKSLSQTITQQLLRPLVGFNFGWDAPVPEYRMIVEEPEDLKSLAETYQVLVSLGFDMSQEHISDRFKVPIRKEGETPLGPSKADDSLEGASDENSLDEDDGVKSRASVRGKTGVQPEPDFSGPAPKDTADLITDRLGDLAEEESDGLIDPIARLLESSDSLEAFRDGLIDLYPEIDPTRLGELIQQALAVADLSGRADAMEGLS